RVLPNELDRPFDAGQVRDIPRFAAVQWDGALSLCYSVRSPRPGYGRKQLFNSRKGRPDDPAFFPGERFLDRLFG
ncbi:MAG TPA: hypothetical protein VIK48_03280, partial [Candidatus Manganitrophaceae bacterium]